MTGNLYPTDLTDPEWEYLQPLLPALDPRRQLGGLNEVLRREVRAAAGKRAQPIAPILDSQTVGTAAHCQTGSLPVPVVPRIPPSRFVVLPKRRIIERTFGWLMKHRRLVRHCEVKPEHAEAWIYLALIAHHAPQDRLILCQAFFRHALRMASKFPPSYTNRTTLTGLVLKPLPFH